MKAIVVGGTFDTAIKKKESKIVHTIAEALDAYEINGGGYERLEAAITSVKEKDLIVWMPNVPNEAVKMTFKKDKGAVAIISKRIGGLLDRTEMDAVSRIFKFGANAVITIRDEDWAPEDKLQFSKPSYVFKLIDALGNVWVEETKDIKDIVLGIYRLYMWTKGSVRIQSVLDTKIQSFKSLSTLLALNKQVAIQCQKAFGERYFGNLSTRCAAMFPSMRSGKEILVSARNTDKEHLTIEDMVFVSGQMCGGPKKPSVDTPVQQYLYGAYPNINFMIHGHAYIKGCTTTKDYFPCGDLREAYAIVDMFPSKNLKHGVPINLKNHGFLIMADTLDELEWAINNSVFETKGIESLNRKE